MYLLQKSADSNTKKITFPINQPAVAPVLLHVELHDVFSLK